MHYLEVVGGQRITAAGSEQEMRVPQDPAYTPGRAVTGTPKPTKLLSWDFINVLVSSYPRSRMNAQAGSPTDELLIFLCHLRTNWRKAENESKKLNDMTTVLDSKWHILHTASSSLRWYHQGWSSNSRRSRFGALARWNAVTCDISQDRGIDTASFAANGNDWREKPPAGLNFWT